MSTKMPPIDFNFYPEQHLDELDQLWDEEVPKGWTIGRFIEEVYNAKLLLWHALYKVDDDGYIKPRWK